MIGPYAGATAPDGWLMCDGAAHPRGDFAALYGVLGDVYGAGDGSTTFNVPDLRKRVPVGKGASGTLSALGAVGGEEEHSLTVAEMPAHRHGTNTGGTSAGTPSGTVTSTFTGAAMAAHTHTIASEGGSTAHNNMPPHLVINYLIRAV